MPNNCTRKVVQRRRCRHSVDTMANAASGGRQRAHVCVCVCVGAVGRLVGVCVYVCRYLCG